MGKREDGHAAKRERILALLANGAVADIHKITLVLCLTQRNSLRHVLDLKDLKQVRVVRWFDPDAACTGRENYPRPYYGLGSEPDAKRPVWSVSKSSKAYRARIKRDQPDVYDVRKARKLARERTPQIDPVLRALYAGRT